MKIAILGTGRVGKVLASKLLELGKDVVMGTRDVSKTMAPANNRNSGDDGTPTFSEWLMAHKGIDVQNFDDAARSADIVFLAVPGEIVLRMVEGIDPPSLSGKIVIDLSNPLDFSNGMPPSLSVVNTDSLGERVQALLPDSRVVKTLNTVSAAIMINPGQLGQSHSMFVAGNDQSAKDEVRTILENWFGWDDVIDLGDISQARGMEMYLPLWLRLWGSFGNTEFNIKVVRPEIQGGN